MNAVASKFARATMLETARRSLNLMFADWANRGLNLWTVKQGTITLTAGSSTGNSNR